MHVENELVEIVTTDDGEFKEIIEQYKEEVPEPPLTDLADSAAAQGMLRCITLIFYNH